MALQFDNKISLGHMLTGGAMAAAGLIAWANLQSNQDRMANDLALIRAEQVAAEQVDQQQDARIRAVELAAASQSSDLRNIQVTLGEIKVTLDRLAAQP